MSTLNFALLAKPEDRGFAKEIASAHLKLQAQQEAKFFDQMLTDLEYDIPVDTGNEILLTLCRPARCRSLSHCAELPGCVYSACCKAV